MKNKTIPYGETPNCVRCGECFDNWDRILKDLKKQTEEGVENAERVKITGADPNDMFHGMENQLEEIKSILSGASIKNEELEEVQRVINDITEALQGTTTELDNLDNSLANTKQSIQQVSFLCLPNCRGLVSILNLGERNFFLPNKGRLIDKIFEILLSMSQKLGGATALLPPPLTRALASTTYLCIISLCFSLGRDIDRKCGIGSMTSHPKTSRPRHPALQHPVP